MSENQPDNLEPVVNPDSGGSSGMSHLERQWGMFCHLAGLAGALIPAFGNVIGPLIIWLMKKDEFPFVNTEGKESLNFQISIAIYLAGSMCLFIFGGWIAAIAVQIFAIVQVILASIKANEGKPYKYPLTIKFIK